MQHRRLPQRHLDLLDQRLQPLRALPHQIDQRALGQPHAEQVGEQLLRAGVGHKLLLDKIGRHRPQARAILARGCHARWYLAFRRHAARQTAPMQDLMLGHRQAHGRQLVDLAPLDPVRRILRQLLLAPTAPRGAMFHHRVGRLHQPHVVATMTRLATGLLTAFLPQTLRLAGEPIAGGGLAAVAAVLGQLPAQLLHLGQQPLHLLPQSGILRTQAGVLVFECHAASLPDKATPS